MRGDPGAQHAQQLDELELRRRVGIDGHPSMVSRIANLSKLDVALVIEADGNMNMHEICPADLGPPRDVGHRRHRRALELVPGRCLDPSVPRWSRSSSRRAAITSA